MQLSNSAAKVAVQQFNLSETEFNSIRGEINELVHRMHPSGSNGQTEPFMQEVHDLILRRGVDPRSYWEDVWIRGGQKDILDYNKLSFGHPVESYRAAIDDLHSLAAKVSKEDVQRAPRTSFWQAVKHVWASLRRKEKP